MLRKCNRIEECLKFLQMALDSYKKTKFYDPINLFTIYYYYNEAIEAYCN